MNEDFILALEACVEYQNIIEELKAENDRLIKVIFEMQKELDNGTKESKEGPK